MRRTESRLMRRTRSCRVAGLIAACATTGAGAVPPAKVALTGGRIVPVAGPEIEKGTILIEHGKITAVGASVELPFDAMEVDVSGKVLFPGLVNAHDWQGLDIPNENLDIGAALDVYDAIDPSRLFFENSLRDGVTTVHIIQANNCVIGGISRVVRPIGLDVDEMTVKPRAGVKMSASPKGGYDRMAQWAILREAFAELADYRERLAEQRYEEEQKKLKKDVDVGPAEARKRGAELIRPQDYDDAHANLHELSQGRLDAWVYVGAATDVGPAVKFAKDNGFFERVVFVLGPDTFKAADELKAAGRPVVLDVNLDFRERDPLTGKLKETFVPKVIADAGLTFALLPHPDASLAERYLTYQAARCIREGVARETALAAVTINPAKMLGLGDALGSLEVGKAGNVVVYSDDPLDFNTWVEQVYIDGILAYDRAKDVRIRRLMEEPGAEEKPKAPAGDSAVSDPAQKEDKPGAGEGATDPAKPENKEESQPDSPAPPTPSPEPGDDGASVERASDRADRAESRRRKDNSKSKGGPDA
ncbi:MAG: Adenine deaminase [Phycisphaerae bacterium]|nr:Adenine deaminase [Phycisphaerae bacterium]